MTVQSIREEFPVVVDRVLLDDAGNAEEQSGYQTGDDAAPPGTVHSTGGDGSGDVVPAVG